MTHRDLVESAYKWVLNKSCGFAFKDLSTMSAETPDVIGFGSYMHSIMIECKVSRSDFFADQKKPFRLFPENGVGRYRFYCCPTGLLKVSDLPDNWGLIYVDEKGKARCVWNPYTKYPEVSNVWRGGFKCNEVNERALMYSALRRLHLRGRVDEIYQDFNPRLTLL